VYCVASVGIGHEPGANSSIDVKIADVLGVGPGALAINDMAVHPITAEIFISVTRIGNFKSDPAILKVSQDGGIELLDLASLSFQKQRLDHYPDQETTFRPRGVGKMPPMPRDIAKGSIKLSSLGRSPQVIPVSSMNDAKVYTKDDLPRGGQMDMSPQMPIGPVGKTVMFDGMSLHIDALGDGMFVSLTRDMYTGSLNMDSNPSMFPNRFNNLVAEYDFPQYYEEKSK